ncbi:Ig-like domain-containing protein [Thalassotalea fusca]
MKSLFWLLSLLIITGCGGGGSSSENGGGSSAVNNPPIATDDTVAVNVNSSISINVLSNDRDQDALSVQSTTTPSSGMVTNNQNSIIYTPNQGFIGEDSFTYTIVDTAGQTASAKVSLTVNNVAPSLTDDSITTNQSAAVVILPLANDSSQAGHELTIVSISTPLYGELEQNDAEITYTPQDGYVGEDAFVYTVRDAVGDESSASVNLNIVNVVPVTSNDVITTEQNKSVNLNPLDNDYDVAGDSIELISIQASENSTHVVEEDGSVTYKPNDGFAGNETLTYTVADEHGGVAQGSIVVNVVNLLPQVINDESFTLRNTTKIIDAMANDSDVVGDEISIVSVSAPSNGVAAIKNNTIEYTPNNDFLGTEIFNYTVEDVYGGTSTGIIQINVNDGAIVSGTLVDFPKAGVEVTLFVGDFQASDVTNANGEYSIVADLNIDDALVSLTAEDVIENYTQVAYLGMSNDLLDRVDIATNSLNEQDISHFTTAVYQMVNLAMGGVAPRDAEEYRKALSMADSEYVFQMVHAAKLMLTDNGISLPEGFSSINELQSNIRALSQQLGNWRTNYNTQYISQQEEIYNNSGSIPASEKIGVGVNMLSASATSFGSALTYGYNFHFELNDNQTGTIQTAYTAENASVTWASVGQELAITMQDSTYFYLDYYCEDQETLTAWLSYSRFTLKHLYSTPEYDVFIQKTEAETGDVNCGEIETHHYSTVRHYNAIEFSMSPGKYLLDTAFFNNSSNEFERVARIVDAFENGLINEFDIDGNLLRTGSWSYSNNALKIDFNDGVSITYSAVEIADGVVYQSLAETSNEMKLSFIADFESLDINHEHQAPAYNDWSTVSWQEDKVYDDNLVQRFRYKLNEEGDGSTQILQADGTWLDDENTKFYWVRTDTGYTFEYYHDYNSGSRDRCDVQLESCYISKSRNVSYIKSLGDYHLTHVDYTSYSSDGQSRYKIGYVGHYKYE